MNAKGFSFLAGIFLTGFAGLTSAAAVAGPLVDPADLQGSGAEPTPIILDIRGDGYAKGHIEGALSAPYALFRGPASNPGQIVPEDQLETVYEELGLAMDRPIVIVSEGDSDNDFGASARVYWTLKSSGFTDLSILNGGMTAWGKAGKALDTDPVKPQPTELDITWDNRWTANTQEVADVVEGKREAVLVDARPPEFYEGDAAHDAAERPGTIPGAKNLAHSAFFKSGSTQIDQVTDVAALKSSLGIDEREEVVSFCNTGHWAATDWFAMSELAGIQNVKLYPGSMVEYSQSDLEMTNVPGLVENLMNQFRQGQ